MTPEDYYRLVEPTMVDGIRKVSATLYIAGFSTSAYGVDIPDTHDVWRMNVPSPGLRATTFFQLHDRGTLKRDWNRGYGLTIKELRALNCPVCVWSPDDWKDVRNTVKFPRKKIEALTTRGKYHQSSFDWMLCLAIHMKYKRVVLYGVDFGPWDGAEPMSGRACLEYWVGVAEERGVLVQVREPTSLFKTINYVRSDFAYGDPDFRHIYNLTSESLKAVSKKQKPVWHED